MNSASDKDKSGLISALMDASTYPHVVADIRLIETHISWVILTGRYAYKIKKPVSLGFLDFSTLQKRKQYCEEEVRLNRRLAPGIYLGVDSIRGTPANPHIDGEGEILEYAVKMVQFPQQAQLDQMLERGELQPMHMDALAHMVADFHQRIEMADSSSDYGTPEHVMQPVIDTISQLRRYMEDATSSNLVEALEQWCQTNYSRLRDLFAQRKAQGYVRECHGDMHLRNLAWIDNMPVAFDCIEFNPELRWIDVISEIAFLVMDLDDRQQAQLAQRFLNAYLEHSGDYQGVRLLRFYLVYRALVRAMVDAIRAGQEGIEPGEKRQAKMEAQGYLKLAQGYTRYSQPQLIIARGLSGSGKSTYSQLLLEQLPAIRIRSDVERKRLYGLKPEQNGHKLIGEEIYSATATERTYQRLRQLAADILDCGYSVIVDATCQKLQQRQNFQELARHGGWPYIILDFTASPDTLRHRVAARHDDVSDADLRVLELQLASWQPLDDEEFAFAITIDTEQLFDTNTVVEEIRRRTGIPAS